MATIVDDNWILTKAEGPSRTSWSVVRHGTAIHSDELAGDDPSAFLAYRAGLEWAERHCPGVSFHWRHQAHAATIRRESSLSQRDEASDARGKNHDDTEK